MELTALREAAEALREDLRSLRADGSRALADAEERMTALEYGQVNARLGFAGVALHFAFLRASGLTTAPVDGDVARTQALMQALHAIERDAAADRSHPTVDREAAARMLKHYLREPDE